MPFSIAVRMRPIDKSSLPPRRAGSVRSGVRRADKGGRRRMKRTYTYER